jgi:ankyrin repeat protein
MWDWEAQEEASQEWDPYYVSPPWAGAGFHEAAATDDFDALYARWDALLVSDLDNKHPERALDSTAIDGRVWAGGARHSELRRTPLMLAALGGHKQMVRCLLAMGAHARLKDADGKSARQHASRKKLHELLLNAVSPEAQLARNRKLLAAARQGDVDAVEQALADGASPDVRELLAEGGKSPLHYACQAGNSEMMELLLDYGADVEVACLKQGDTPLLYACKQSDADVVEALLSAGVEVSAANKRRAKMFPRDMTRPLHRAIRHGDPEQSDCVRILLEHDETRSVIEAEDGFGDTALWSAVAIGNADAVDLLLQFGADFHTLRGDLNLEQYAREIWKGRNPRLCAGLLELLRVKAAEREELWFFQSDDDDFGTEKEELMTMARHTAADLAESVTDLARSEAKNKQLQDCVAALRRAAEATAREAAVPAPTVAAPSVADSAVVELTATLAAMTVRAEAAEAQLKAAGEEQAVLRARVAALELAAETAERGQRVAERSARGADARAAAATAIVGVKRERAQKAEAAAARAEHRLDAASTCIVCFEAPRNVLFIPCSHLAVCQGCCAREEQKAYDNLSIGERKQPGARGAPKCPACQTVFTDKRGPVFLP